jgi:hypothetical protein
MNPSPLGNPVPQEKHQLQGGSDVRLDSLENPLQEVYPLNIAVSFSWQ